MLASCAVDIKFHDWETCECLGVVSAPDPKNKGFLDISWGSEGKHLVTVPATGKSLVIHTNQPSAHLAAREDRWKPGKEFIDIPGVRCASCSRQHNTNVVLGTMTGEVLLYNLANRKIMQTYADLPAAVELIESGAQDQFIAAGCGNGQIYMYGTGHSVTASLFIPCSETVNVITVHPKLPHLLAGGSEKGVIAIWDVNTGTGILNSTNHSGSVLDMSFSVSDDSFVTIGADQKINIYDLRTNECVHEKQFDSDLTALAYCPNGNDIAVATARGQVICLDKRYLHSCKAGLKAHKSAIRKIAFDQLDAASVANTYYSKSSVDVDFCDDDPMPVPQSELKTPGSGDCSCNKNGKVRFRNLYTNMEKSSIGTSRCHMNNANNMERTRFHIIDENCLNSLREEISKANKEIVTGLIETMNNDFLRLRMGVSREFCTMEIRNKKRWQEFNMVLLKIAEIDDHDTPEMGEPTAIDKMSLHSQLKNRMSTCHMLPKNLSNRSVK